MAARVAALIFGSATVALGIVLAVKATLGPASWDILHLAIVGRTGLSLGQVSIAMSLFLITLTIVLGGLWTVRWGTVVNTFVIGICIELFIGYVIPDVHDVWLRLAYVGLGTFAFACGTVIYTRAGFGAGARDGLILVLSERLPFTVGKVRLGLEALVAGLGWLLGGPVGPATLVIVFGTGPLADLLFGRFGRGQLPTTVRIPERV